MADYFVRINEDIAFEINGLEGFDDLYISEQDISEHFRAQYIHQFDSNIPLKDMKFEPILIAVDKVRFKSLLQKLREKTGVDYSFVKSIPITIAANGNEVIRVINSEHN